MEEPYHNYYMYMLNAFNKLKVLGNMFGPALAAFIAWNNLTPLLLLQLMMEPVSFNIII